MCLRLRIVNVNPSKIVSISQEKIRLKYKVSYEVDSIPNTETGEVDSFPNIQE